MKTEVIKRNNIEVVVVNSDRLLITDEIGRAHV